jgi:hypothetical protein
VPEGKYNSLGEDPKPALYTPLYRDYSVPTLVARTRGDPRAVLSALRAAVQKLDPSVSVYSMKTLKEHMGAPLFPARMAAIALGSFGVPALSWQHWHLWRDVLRCRRPDARLACAWRLARNREYSPSHPEAGDAAGDNRSGDRSCDWL